MNAVNTTHNAECQDATSHKKERDREEKENRKYLVLQNQASRNVKKLKNFMLR